MDSRKLSSDGHAGTVGCALALTTYTYLIVHTKKLKMTREKGVTKAQRWFCPSSGSHEGSRWLLPKALTGWEVGTVSLSPCSCCFFGCWALEAGMVPHHPGLNKSPSRHPFPGKAKNRI